MGARVKRMGSVWALSWPGSGFSGKKDGVWVGAIMAGTWMLWNITGLHQDTRNDVQAGEYLSYPTIIWTSLFRSGHTSWIRTID